MAFHPHPPGSHLRSQTKNANFDKKASQLEAIPGKLSLGCEKERRALFQFLEIFFSKAARRYYQNECNQAARSTEDGLGLKWRR